MSRPPTRTRGSSTSGRGRGSRRASARGAAAAAAAPPPEPPEAEEEPEEEEPEEPPPFRARDRREAAEDGGVAELIVGVERMRVLPTFNVSNISLPWRMATTGFVEGARWCYVDFWTLSMSDMFMKLSLNNEGTALNVRWGVLRPFVTADRILQEFGLTSERDPRVAAYNDTTEQILAAYPGDQVIYSDPQVVQLPFAVEASFQDSLIWGDGDVLLRNEFFAGRRPVPVQLMPFLRVEMRSQVKAAAKKSRGGNVIIQSALDWATPPPPSFLPGHNPHMGPSPSPGANQFGGNSFGHGLTYADMEQATGASPEQAKAAAEEMREATERAKALKRLRRSLSNEDCKPAAKKPDNSTTVTPGRDDMVESASWSEEE